MNKGFGGFYFLIRATSISSVTLGSVLLQEVGVSYWQNSRELKTQSLGKPRQYLCLNVVGTERY